MEGQSTGVQGIAWIPVDVEDIAPDEA